MKCLTQFKFQQFKTKNIFTVKWFCVNVSKYTFRHCISWKKKSEVWFILFLINNTHDGDLKMHHNETLSLVQHSTENCPRKQSHCSTMPQETELPFMAYNSLVHYSIFILLSYKQKKNPSSTAPVHSYEVIRKYLKILAHLFLI